jgi:hypothetical protein
MSDIANIYARIGNIQTQINNVTANTSSNYNQLTLALTQQANISAAILNSNGSGNLNTGNLNLTGNIYCKKIATESNQTPFRIEYGTTDIINTSTTITFSSPFTVAPAVFTTGDINSTTAPFVYIRTISTTQCLLFAKDQTSSNYGNIVFNWVAIGI